MATVNEIISKIRSASIPEGKMLHVEKGDGKWMAQIQNHGTEEYDIKNNSSKLKSGAWGRIWYDGKLKEQFKGPLNVVKNEMIKYLSSQETKDSAMEYDPITCMMVPTKDQEFKKGDKFRNGNSVVEIDYYDKNGDVQYRHNKQAQSATEKGLKHMLERNGYKKVNDATTWVVEYEDALGDDHKKTFTDKTAVEKFIRRGTDVGKAYHLKVNGKAVNNMSTWTADAKANDASMVYDEVMAMMKPATAKDQRTVDFSSSDAKKVFEYIDRLVTKDMNDYPREIERAKTSADCERLENAIRTTLDNVVDEYIQIWNEVGLYAQKRKNEVVDRYGKLMSQAFKKYNELKARE